MVISSGHLNLIETSKYYAMIAVSYTHLDVYKRQLYSWAMIESVPAALNMLIPLSMLSAAFGLILVFGFYHAQGYLFDFQDYDLLASMPLTRRQILMSKLVALVAMMLIYSAFLTLPMMALFQLRYAMPATFLLYGLIGQLFLPIVPMSVACLAAVVVRLVSSHVKHPVLIRNVPVSYTHLDRDGKFIYYELNMSVFSEVLGWSLGFIKEKESGD